MATASVPTPAAEPQAAISPFGRIVGAFFSPKATFEDIVRKPTWILPTALILVLGVGGVVALNQHFDWRGYMAQQIEKSPQAANLSAEQKQQRIEGGAKYAPVFAYVFGAPVPLLMLLVITLVLWGAYNLMAGAGANFKTSFAIAAHASVPPAIIATILFLTVLFLKPIGAFDLENPVATNLAVLLPEESAKWLVALCKNIDVIEFWKLILLAMGFAAVNPRKLKGAKPYTIAFGVFAVYIVIRVGFAFIFS
ncbi:MAG: YIP1 family protein [Candidatus Acidiferrum sp.]